MDAARAQNSRRHGALDRLRSGVVGEPGGHRAGDQAVLHQDGEHGVGHPGLAGRRQPAEQHETGHLAEGDLSQEISGQVVAANQNAVQLGLAQAGDDFRLVAHTDSLAFFLIETYGMGGVPVKASSFWILDWRFWIESKKSKIQNLKSKIRDRGLLHGNWNLSSSRLQT